MRNNSLFFSTKDTTITITSKHIQALGACGYGIDSFAEGFPKGCKLDQTSLNNYYSKNKLIPKIGYNPSWLFNRIGIDMPNKNTYESKKKSFADVKYSSNIPVVVAARKVISVLEKKRGAEIRKANKAIIAKYRPRIAKAEKSLNAVCKKYMKEFNEALKAKVFKTPTITLSRFTKAFNAAMKRREIFFPGMY